MIKNMVKKVWCIILALILFGIGLIIGLFIPFSFVSQKVTLKEATYQNLCDQIKENPSYLSNWLPYNPEEEKHVLSLSGELAYYTAEEDGFKKSDRFLYALWADDKVVTICTVLKGTYSIGDMRTVGYLDYWQDGEAIALIDDARGLCAVSLDGTITRLTDIYVDPAFGYVECTSEYAASHLDELVFTYCYPHTYLLGDSSAVS